MKIRGYRVFFLFLIVLACMTAAACAAEAAEKVYKIATVVKESSDPWFIRMEEGVRRFAADTGHEAYQKGPGSTDSAQQIQVLEELAAQDIDALCVVPIDPSACEPVLKKAMDKGIVVITHEATSQQNMDFNIEAFDNVGYGAYMMDELAKAMGESGRFVTMVSYLTNASHMEWAASAISRAQEKYPNIELIAEERVETQDNLEVAYERAKELLKKYPDLKGFLGTSSNDAPGAGKAIGELGLIGRSFSVGTSVTSVAAPYLDDGSTTAVTCWDPAEAGYAMNVLAVMVLDGRRDEIKSGLNLGVTGFENINADGKLINGQGWIVITKDNMAEYDF
ncbi:MAG: autoinducer 2 ABC transporter substrate-binding protein [Synergistaceae bacterium]|jgi:simple sugar transport system substrate-binding protein|nr:autoinducer 2 ABC transporter substrate-binding protein [Synergistaceae bacterium]